MKDLILIGGAIAILGVFGVGQFALNSHAQTQALKQEIEQLQQENRDQQNQLIGCYAN